jgi:hypothetical protein
LEVSIFFKNYNQAMNTPFPKLLRRTAFVLGLMGALLQAEDSFAQRKKKKDEATPAPAAPAPGRFGAPGALGAPANGPKPYKEVITAKAKTKAGLFKVHQVEDKYF